MFLIHDDPVCCGGTSTRSRCAVMRDGFTSHPHAPAGRLTRFNRFFLIFSIIRLGGLVVKELRRKRQIEWIEMILFLSRIGELENYSMSPY